jgi:KipI family sensor histidine kinase inhibitor
MYREPRLLTAGDRAVVVEFGGAVSPEINEKVRKLLLHIEKFPIRGVEEAVPTYRSLLIHYDPMSVSFEGLRDAVQTAIRESVDIPLPRARRVVLPTKYGGDRGPDIEYVAEHNKLTVDDVIRIHSGTDYLVYMIGFTPGFPYLGELPPSIACPRLSTPRIKVPAGSVGIAGTLTGVYSVDSPGGWRLIGQTPLKLFDETLDPPSLLQAGDHVRFVPISEEDFKRLESEVRARRYTPEISYLD